MRKLWLALAVGVAASLGWADDAAVLWAQYNATGMQVGEQQAPKWKTLPDQSGNGNTIEYCMGTAATELPDADRGAQVIYNDGQANAGLRHAVDSSFTSAFSGQRSIALWFKRPATDDLFGDPEDTKLYLFRNFYGFSVFTYKGSNQLQMEANEVKVGAPVEYLRSRWTHLAFTLVTNANTTVSLLAYVDGQPVVKTTVDLPPEPIADAYFSLFSEEVDATHPLLSYADDIRLYTGALTAAQIKNLAGGAANEYYLRYGSGSLADLAATAAQRVTDLSGSGNHGMTGGGVDSVGISGEQDLWRGYPLDLSGQAGSYISSYMYFRPSVTFSVWVKPDLTGYRFDAGSTAPQFLVTNLCGVSIWNSLTEDRWHCDIAGRKLGGSTQVRRGDWQQVGFTIAAAGDDDGVTAVCTVAFFVDGEKVGEAKNIELPYGSGGVFWLFNSSYYNQQAPFWALADDLRIYNRALSEEEMATEYANNRQRLALVAHFPMDKIEEKGGVRTTPNLAWPDSPMTLGALAEAASGVEGAGAIYFNAPSNENEVVESWGACTNPVFHASGTDFALSMWTKASREEHSAEAVRLFRASGTGAYFEQRGSHTNCSFYFNGGQLGNVALEREEAWTHYVYLFQDVRNGPSHSTVLKLYRNGKLTNSASISGDLKNIFTQSGCAWAIASSAEHTHPARCQIDDLRMLAGRITEADVKSLYCGPAVPDAGEDFTVAGETARLNGQLSPYACATTATGFDGASEWRLVSAPVGGESAAIASPNALSTDVTLPVLGEYVFELASQSLGFETTSQVQVTRDDAMTPAGVAATVSVRAADGLCAIVEATGLAAGARVKWSQISGPGGAFFRDDTAADTLVTFSTAGDYTLGCTVTDGKASTRYELTLTTSGTSVADQLETSLDAWWDLNSTNGKGGSEAFAVDRIGGYEMYNPRLSYECGLTPVPGVGGLYGMQNGWNEPAQSVEEANAGFEANRHYNSQEITEWHAVSLWFYHQGDDVVTNAACRVVNKGALLSSYTTRYLYYTPNRGTSTDFYFEQRGESKEKYGFYFKGPSANLTNRWVHVVLQVKQSGSGMVPELWLDGDKLTLDDERSSSTIGSIAKPKAGVTDYRYWFMGLKNNELLDTGDNEYGHIPGCLDEVRIYNRHLSEAEIRCLYEYPSGYNVALAPSVSVPLATVKMKRRIGETITAEAFAAEAGAELTYRWTVIEGDATKLVFSDQNALSTKVTAMRDGSYKIQLVADDGTRATYSEPISLVVTAVGSLTIFR